MDTQTLVTVCDDVYELVYQDVFQMERYRSKRTGLPVVATFRGVAFLMKDGLYYISDGAGYDLGVVDQESIREIDIDTFYHGLALIKELKPGYFLYANDVFSYINSKYGGLYSHVWWSHVDYDRHTGFYHLFINGHSIGDFPTTKDVGKYVDGIKDKVLRLKGLRAFELEEGLALLETGEVMRFSKDEREPWRW